ncbi:MAG: SRPBCC family protein [Nannocystaceae bacterium]
MEKATQIAMIERVLAHLEARTTDMIDAQGRVPSAWYLDPGRLERERAALFRRLPLCVGPSHLVRGPGDFLTHDVDGIPVLVSRDRDGRLGAFLNVCRHRGTRLVDAAVGEGKKSFVCPYHAWTYGTDGALLGIPHAGGFPDVDRGRCGLVRLPVGEAHGLVFVIPVRADARPEGDAIDLDAHLSGLGPDLAALKIGDHVSYEVRTIRRRFNWKLTFDIFLEAYHLRVAHAASIYPMFFDNVGLFDAFGPHQRNVFPKRAIAGLADVDRERWDIRPVANVLFQIFPNTIILVEPDHMAMFSVYPDGLGGARLESRMLLPEPPQGPRAEAYWQKNAAILHGAIDEDFALGESIQSAFAAGANEAMNFGRYEQGLTRFHAAVAQALDEG